MLKVQKGITTHYKTALYTALKDASRFHPVWFRGTIVRET